LSPPKAGEKEALLILSLRETNLFILERSGKTNLFMIGVFLTSISTLFEEIFDTIGKYKHVQGEQSIYTMGFLSLLGTSLFFLALMVYQRSLFHFSLASLPTFIPRVILSIVQEYITIAAIMKADRTTFGFIRIGTIPLLLMVDLVLGYSLGISQIVGIGLILLTLIILFENRVLDKKGIGLVLFSTINAVVVISLYKYDITYFNSVAAEQGIVSGILAMLFLWGAVYIAKENPLAFLTKPIFLVQAGSQTIAGILDSFAYVFAPASIIVAAKRSSAMVWTIVSGNIYFRETHARAKIIAVAFLVAGILLLVV